MSNLPSEPLNTLSSTPKQVRGQAVEVLQRAEDEELACYLLQLTAALRYELSDDSRLARFLVERCVQNAHNANPSLCACRTATTSLPYPT